ncbi:tetratricopeptide repeat protein [Sinomicrobium sp.]
MSVTKAICCLIGLLFAFQVFSQEEILAQQYFDGGEFGKALALYEKLYETNPRSSYIRQLVACYQQLEQYDKAEEVLQQASTRKNASPLLFIELGYNCGLQEKKEEAEAYYNKAIEAVIQRPAYAYTVGQGFQDKNLLDRAITTYEKGKELDSKINVDYQIAQLYGEKGDMDKMYNSLLDLISSRKNTNLSTVRQIIARFISEDPSNPNNVLLRKLVLKRAQDSPNTLWNEILSWLFVRQRQYDRAFSQEKAIFNRREGASLQPIADLGLQAMNDEDYEVAIEVFEFIIAHSSASALQIGAQLYTLNIKTKIARNSDDYRQIDQQYQKLLNEYGKDENTLSLQISYAKFLAFTVNDLTGAENLLDECKDLRLDPHKEAQLKMAHADILLYGEKFNRALIYYSQVQKMMKNDVIGQEARFKVAQASFYKGDFNWALTQLKVLRSSASQLIANDAMQLSLLISDNMQEDSTNTALKLYAKADLLSYQQKHEEAVVLLDSVLNNHRGESLEDEALLKQAELYVKQKDYEKAEFNYLRIIEFYPFDILIDDALYALAELYEKHLENPEKALPYYEKIIFEHQDSIYFIPARKAYRKLRGDQGEKET